MPLTLTALPGQPPLPLTVVPDSGELVIGRGSDCGLVLVDASQRVSLRHCRIAGQSGRFTLTDSSTNGTLVNERPLAAPHQLAEGDVIGIGGYRLRAGLGAARGGAMNLDSWGNAGGVAAPVPPPFAPPASPFAAVAPPTAPRPAAAGPGGELLAAAGLPRSVVAIPDAELLCAAGAVLAALAEGLAAQAAARAQARRELGLPTGTAPAAEALLAQWLAPGGAVAATRLLAETAAHSEATLHGVQAGLRTTLEALAPAALRRRHKGNPAALWQAYEAAFAGGPDDPAFIDRFAKAFAAAYAARADTAR